MSESLPVLLVPGLGCSARLYAPQMAALWQAAGPVMVAKHTGTNTIRGIAQAILAAAPPRFHLAGLSMGGYISFEILRQAAERVAKLALIDTGSRADTAEQTERRNQLIALAQEDKLAEINDTLWPLLIHPSRQSDKDLRATVDAMMFETGAEGFVRQQQALIGRPDSRPLLASVRASTIVIVGDGDKLTPPALSEEIAAAIPHARLEIVRECGHLSTLDRPEAATKLLVNWFGG